MALPGSNIVLYCNLTGNTDNVKYSWFHNGQQVELPSESSHIISQGGELILENVSSEDNGMYQCRVYVQILKQMYSSVELSVGEQLLNMVCIFIS